MSCNICANSFNKSTHKPITCVCNYVVCRLCIKQWMVVSSNITCMSCNTEWSNEFVIENLSKHFLLNEMIKIRKNILLNQQRLLLVNSMEDSKRYISLKECRGMLSKLYNERDILYKQKRNLKSTSKKSDAVNKRIIFRLLKTNRAELSRVELELRSYQNLTATIDIYSQLSNNINRQNLYLPCLITNCKGVIVDNKCGICQTIICSKCYSIESQDHVCLEEDVKTYQNIMETVKSCPSCREGIYKINGCNIMFCTRCKTGFNWNTLEIIRGQSQIHNPHFFEYINDAQAIEEDRLVHSNRLHRYIHNNEFEFASLYVISDLLGIRDNIIEHLGTYNMKYHLLRLKYLADEISESTWRDQIYNLHKYNIINSAIIDLINNNINTHMVDLSHNIVKSNQSELNIIDTNMINIVNNINDDIKIIYGHNCSSSKRFIESKNIGGFIR